MALKRVEAINRLLQTALKRGEAINRLLQTMMLSLDKTTVGF
jgi:hypothetical protein